MSETPGKVHILGRSEVDGREVFVLQDLQCRRPDLVCRPFFARFDPTAAWPDQLVPASESDAAFFPRRLPGRGAGRRALVPLRVAVTRD